MKYTDNNHPATPQHVLRSTSMTPRTSRRKVSVSVIAVIAALSPTTVAFVYHQQPITRNQQQSSSSVSNPRTTANGSCGSRTRVLNLLSVFGQEQIQGSTIPSVGVMAVDLPKRLSSVIAGVAVIVALSFGGFPGASWAENELSDKYGGKGFDSSLVDQTCLIDKCSVQAKACLADDPSCRKGLTCTAKCLGDNS